MAGFQERIQEVRDSLMELLPTPSEAESIVASGLTRAQEYRKSLEPYLTSALEQVTNTTLGKEGQVSTICKHHKTNKHTHTHTRTAFWLQTLALFCRIRDREQEEVLLSSPGMICTTAYL